MEAFGALGFFRASGRFSHILIVDMPNPLHWVLPQYSNRSIIRRLFKALYIHIMNIRLGPGRSGQRFLFGFLLFPTS